MQLSSTSASMMLMKVGVVRRPQEDPVTVGRGLWQLSRWYSDGVHRLTWNTAGGSTFLSLKTSSGTLSASVGIPVKNHGAPQVDLSQAPQALF